MLGKALCLRKACTTVMRNARLRGSAEGPGSCTDQARGARGRGFEETLSGLPARRSGRERMGRHVKEPQGWGDNAQKPHAAPLTAGRGWGGRWATGSQELSF